MLQAVMIETSLMLSITAPTAPSDSAKPRLFGHPASQWASAAPGLPSPRSKRVRPASSPVAPRPPPRPHNITPPPLTPGFPGKAPATGSVADCREGGAGCEEVGREVEWGRGPRFS